MLVVLLVVLNWLVLEEQRKFKIYQKVLKQALKENGQELVLTGTNLKVVAVGWAAIKIIHY
jgi:hypothetical protein